ncbi:major capsid protein, N4-gp56 family [Bartonella sp. CDC_skunk]|uniref:N4-gp56 family major capsid protein n=1 Tax=Bartonella sp. CDC_skunk TaxID=1933905 RepID=UPI00099A40E3|nr:N4-gp56 family major capsid protein [Bartonella sp. CDC_skunk]AQX21029.1 major capsid protein, N4-gp56 family [Bartonella sp. CDC_skunk]
MATTEAKNINHPLAVKIWSKLLSAESSKATSIAPLMGTDENSIIQVVDGLNKTAGDAVKTRLCAQLIGGDVTEGQALEGNTTLLLNETVRLNELSHAVRFKNKEIIDQQHIPFNLREYAKDGFVDWYADRLSMMFFIQAAGYTAPWMKFDGYTTTIKPVHYGFNEPLEPSKLRIFRSGNKKADEELTKDDEFTLSLIDDAVKRAKLANPKIRSVHVNGESVYVMYLHPEQVMQLRTNTDASQWLDITEAVCSESRAKTPIFDGSFGMYNGTILRESEYVPHGVHSKTQEPVLSVRRAVLLGAQSVILAYGRKDEPRYHLVEKLFDYDSEFGIAAKTIIGMKKSRYTLAYSTQGAQDFGTIVIPSFSKEI